MTADLNPGWCRRRVRDAVRAARKARGLSQREAADALYWSLSKMRRIEAGTNGVSVTDLRALLSLYGVSRPEADALAVLARTARTRPWYARYPVTAVVPGLAQYLEAETCAALVCGYRVNAVPDLLQTPDYARAFLRGLGERRASGLAELLLARQQQLLDHGPRLSYVIDEGALRRYGSTAVMRGQQRRLAALAGHPRISVRVVPFTAGAYPQPWGTYTIIGLPDETPDAVYLETGGSVIRRPGRDEVEQYRWCWNAAQEMSAALEPGSLPGTGQRSPSAASGGPPQGRAPR